MNTAKPIVNRLTVCATVLLAALALPAQAKSAHAGISARISVPHQSGHHVQHAGKRHGHGHHHKHRPQIRHHAHRFHHRRGQQYHPHRSHRRGHVYFRSARGCHPVKRYVYDRHGRANKVVSTICYDIHGNGFIVPRSRYGYRH